MRIIQVGLQDRTYPIFIGRNLGDVNKLLPEFVRNKKKIIVTNPTVAGFYLNSVQNALGASQVVVVPDGEAFKNLESFNRIITELLENNVSRSAVLVALGGGVIGDLTGFAAACYQRGIHFVQYPTTLLAQVDSSVGGKTGVNHLLGKNMIGAFYQPACVIIDTHMLTTLPDREFSSGIAEIIKYGAILDKDFFQWLEENSFNILEKHEESLAYAIERSCCIKSHIVSQDEREAGIRAILNFGHTFGHAIEAWGGYQLLTHGEAVGIGMAMAAIMSCRELGMAEEEAKRLIALIKQMGLSVRLPDGMSTDDFIYYMLKDKKNKGDGIELILLDAIGQARKVTVSDEARVRAGVEAARKALR